MANKEEEITLERICAFRSKAYQMAASGKHGDYPYDETFNDEVEAGFNFNGSEWTANDGTVISIYDI